MKTYLGDSIYAEFRHGDIILTTARNRIVLEPEIVRALDVFREMSKAPREAHINTPHLDQAVHLAPWARFFGCDLTGTGFFCFADRRDYERWNSGLSQPEPMLRAPNGTIQSSTDWYANKDKLDPELWSSGELTPVVRDGDLWVEL